MPHPIDYTPEDDEDDFQARNHPDGHSWVESEETGRCYCEWCGADGDA